MRKIAALFLHFLVFGSLLGQPWFPERTAYSAYQKKDYETAKNILQNEQVEKPNDPLTNYNLGTIYYKENNLDAAKESFQRAATHAFPNKKEILEKSYFNLGNCFYKSAVSTLPENWEKETEKLDEKIKNQAIQELQQAIEKYTNALKQNKDNKQAKTNKKITEEILQKLQKKQTQNQQDKKDEKKQNKDQNKKKNDKNQDKKDKQDQNKDKQNKDQNKQNEDKKDQQNKNDKDKQDEKDKQDQQKKDKEDNKQDKNKDKQDKQDQQKKERQQGQPQPQDLEKRKVQSLLSQLEQAEKDLQKKLFAQKVKQGKPNKNKYQKPW